MKPPPNIHVTGTGGAPGRRGLARDVPSSSAGSSSPSRSPSGSTKAVVVARKLGLAVLVGRVEGVEVVDHHVEGVADRLSVDRLEVGRDEARQAESSQ